MIKNKLLFIAVISSVLMAGSVVLADSNDLLRMDVKKASNADTVDVTFYTTGAETNTVVTHKTGNTYVVLLPNVSGNQSVVPSLGGVKDLVSNINVKNIDDKIGGYTKVTFNTTKPIKIQTYTKKTAPLTKAQQDYRNLIAQNSKFDPDKKMENFKQSNNTKQVNNLSDVAKSAKAQSSQIQKSQETKKLVSNQTTTKTSEQKTNKIALKPVNVNVPQVKQNVLNETKPNLSEQKIKENPVKTEKEEANKKSQTQETPVVAASPAFELTNPPADSKNIQKNGIKSVEKNIKTKVVTKGLPVIPAAGVLTVIGLFMLGVLMNIISKAVKNNLKLKEYLENYNSEPEKTNNADYNDILEKENLNWQEKYKLYSEVKENQDNNNSSYLTDVSGKNGVIVQNDLNARISQMEHSLSKTPSMELPKTKSNKVQSEDDVIVKKMSGLNLKSFAKNIDLKRTTRNHSLPINSRLTKPFKEGKFVSLENSELTMSQRNIAGHGFSISDLARTGRRYLPNRQKQMNQESLQRDEQYLISSLSDYLNIIDEENNTSNIMTGRSHADMMGITNPISGVQPSFDDTMQSQTTENSGIKISAKYDIDNDKSIYMVELDGISALIGKNGENINVLKRFDKIVNKPLQVRPDYGSVYIVKVGGFKCLVDVAEDKMGTLLEI